MSEEKTKQIAMEKAEQDEWTYRLSTLSLEEIFDLEVNSDMIIPYEFEFRDDSKTLTAPNKDHVPAAFGLLQLIADVEQLRLEYKDDLDRMDILDVVLRQSQLLRLIAENDLAKAKNLLDQMPPEWIEPISGQLLLAVLNQLSSWLSPEYNETPERVAMLELLTNRGMKLDRRCLIGLAESNVIYNQVDTLRVILQNNPDIKDAHGCVGSNLFSLILSCSQEREDLKFSELVDLFIEFKLDFYTPDEDGVSAVDLLVEHGQQDLVARIATYQPPTTSASQG